MRSFIDFCLSILKSIVSNLGSFSLGSYSYAEFLVGILVVGVFISSLVIKFKK